MKINGNPEIGDFEEKGITIIPSQLRKARETLGLKPDEVAKNLGINVSDLLSWERGISEPSIDILWDLGELYQRGTEYFLEQIPSLPRHLSFRLEQKKTLNELPQEVRNTLVHFDELCRAETELEEALDKKRNILIQRYNDISPKKLASVERQRLDLGNHSLRGLRNLLIKQGIRVFTLPIPDIPSSELSGVSWWHEVYGPCILINSKNNSGRRLFTLAHEYAHLLHSDPPTICAYMLDIPEERFSNEFAAYFLMPDSDVIDFCRQTLKKSGKFVPTDKELGQLANHYGVSLEAIGYQLEALSLIPQGTTKSRIHEWEQKPSHFRGHRGPKWRRQIGEEFISLALKAHTEGHISLSKLSEYFGQDIRTVMKVAEESKEPKAK